jgi:hypothetical protein
MWKYYLGGTLAFALFVAIVILIYQAARNSKQAVETTQKIYDYVRTPDPKPGPGTPGVVLRDTADAAKTGNGDEADS